MRYQYHGLRNKKTGMSQPSGVIAACIALCLGGNFTPSTAAAVTATEAVKTSIEQVISVLEDKELKKADRVTERRKRLQEIFNERFNYEEMSKRSFQMHARTGCWGNCCKGACTIIRSRKSVVGSRMSDVGCRLSDVGRIA